MMVVVVEGVGDGWMEGLFYSALMQSDSTVEFFQLAWWAEHVVSGREGKGGRKERIAGFPWAGRHRDKD
jgi:hypothetical protein